MKTEMRTAICLLCGNEYHGVSALSRTDNSTYVCADCGSRQALSAMGISEEEQEKILEIIHTHNKAE